MHVLTCPCQWLDIGLPRITNYVLPRQLLSGILQHLILSDRSTFAMATQLVWWRQQSSKYKVLSCCYGVTLFGLPILFPLLWEVSLCFKFLIRRKLCYFVKALLFGLVDFGIIVAHEKGILPMNASWFSSFFVNCARTIELKLNNLALLQVLKFGIVNISVYLHTEFTSHFHWVFLFFFLIFLILCFSLCIL